MKRKEKKAFLVHLLMKHTALSWLKDTLSCIMQKQIMWATLLEE